MKKTRIKSLTITWSHLESCQLQLYIIWCLISPGVMLQV